MKKLFIFLFINTIFLYSNAQHEDALTACGDSIEVWGHQMLTDTILENRQRCSDNILRILQRDLALENSFDFKFDSVQSLSILEPKDGAFRIFTWQLYIDKDTYIYNGIVQLNGKKPKLIPLVDKSNDMFRVEKKKLKANNWYGSLYYKIYPVKHRKGDYYVLFGYDGNDFFNRRKIIDVLSIRNNRISFGSPVFLKEFERKVSGKDKSKKIKTYTRPYHRLLIEYTAAAAVSVNYNEKEKMILFDHCIMQPVHYGDGLAYVPDGSYEGYRLKRGKWRNVKKVYNRVLKEAPRPIPKLDNEDKDLFGKKRKKKE